MQYPDPESVHKAHGIYGVAALCHQSWDPTYIKDVLIRYGANIHPDCWPVGPHIMLHEYGEGFGNLTIGAHAHIGKEVFFDLTNELIIEQSVAVGMRALLLTHKNMGHGYPNKPMTKLFPNITKPTVLRRGCSIGAGATLLCGVEVGEDAVIGAGVVVDRNVPPRTIVPSSRQKPNYQIPERFFSKRAEED
ncbi:MAG: acyltransferase [Nannocystaceae bacterium]|nr:acyltransferase [Nannocystaceae bacterium]